MSHARTDEIGNLDVRELSDQQLRFIQGQCSREASTRWNRGGGSRDHATRTHRSFGARTSPEKQAPPPPPPPTGGGDARRRPRPASLPPPSRPWQRQRQREDKNSPNFMTERDKLDFGSAVPAETPVTTAAVSQFWCSKKSFVFRVILASLTTRSSAVCLKTLAAFGPPVNEEEKTRSLEERWLLLKFRELMQSVGDTLPVDIRMNMH